MEQVSIPKGTEREKISMNEHTWDDHCAMCEKIKQMPDSWRQKFSMIIGEIDPEKCIQHKTQIADHVVSTVYLHADHGLLACQHYWYETMVYKETRDSDTQQEPDANGVRSDCVKRKYLGFQHRYETKEQALEGHERVCGRLRNGQSVEGLEDSYVL